MAIDPRLYEKYSGRSGDPYKRMGEALAQGAARKQELGAAKQRSYSERRIISGLKFEWWWSVIGAIGILIVALTSFWR